MALWFLCIAHDYGIRAETVEVAQAMVDRLSVIDNTVFENFDRYQLSCFACLLSTCKTLEEKQFFKESRIRRVGREYFSPSELNDAELNALYTLKWHINQPSSIAFAYSLLEIVREMNVIPNGTEIKSQVNHHLILSMIDSRFLPFKKSSIALAAVLTVIRQFVEEETLEGLQQDIEEALLFNESFEDELIQLQNMMLTTVQVTTTNNKSTKLFGEHIVITDFFGPSEGEKTFLEPLASKFFQTWEHQGDELGTRI